MFYVETNKMRVFDNCESLPGLFNRSAEMRRYSHVSNPVGTVGGFPESEASCPVCPAFAPRDDCLIAVRRLSH
jgi:hypothetical protein